MKPELVRQTMKRRFTTIQRSRPTVPAYLWSAGLVHTSSTPSSSAGDGDPPLARYAAVLADMDGTLVDSDGAVERSWAAWARRFDVDPAAVLEVCHGGTPRGLAVRFRPDLDDAGLDAAERVMNDLEYADTADIAAAPGALALVAALERTRTPWAVVTNADRRLAKIRLNAAGIRAPMVITLDDVEAGKPDPAGYRLAAARLGVPVESCLVVEDSPAGVAAGRSAGAEVAGVKGVEADRAITDLGQLAEEFLAPGQASGGDPGARDAAADSPVGGAAGRVRQPPD